MYIKALKSGSQKQSHGQTARPNCFGMPVLSGRAVNQRVRRVVNRGRVGVVMGWANRGGKVSWKGVRAAPTLMCAALAERSLVGRIWKVSVAFDEHNSMVWGVMNRTVVVGIANKISNGCRTEDATQQSALGPCLRPGLLASRAHHLPANLLLCTFDAPPAGSLKHSREAQQMNTRIHVLKSAHLRKSHAPASCAGNLRDMQKDTPCAIHAAPRTALMRRCRCSSPQRLPAWR